VTSRARSLRFLAGARPRRARRCSDHAV